MTSFIAGKFCVALVILTYSGSYSVDDHSNLLVHVGTPNGREQGSAGMIVEPVPPTVMVFFFFIESVQIRVIQTITIS